MLLIEEKKARAQEELAKQMPEEVKNEGVQIGTLNSDDVAVELLISSVNPQISEQYFTTPDGRIVVVSSQAQFDKVLGRFLVNVNASNR